VRFQDQAARDTAIKLMTDGILLAETQGDPLLRAVRTLIVDEAHERSLNIDFLLGYLKSCCAARRSEARRHSPHTIDARASRSTSAARR
jgi:ATP-dependent helicase HrpA